MVFFFSHAWGWDTGWGDVGGKVSCPFIVSYALFFMTFGPFFILSVYLALFYVFVFLYLFLWSVSYPLLILMQVPCCLFTPYKPFISYI